MKRIKTILKYISENRRDCGDFPNNCKCGIPGGFLGNILFFNSVSRLTEDKTKLNCITEKLRKKRNVEPKENYTKTPCLAVPPC